MKDRNMAIYVVGEYLREMRMRKGYSQEAVSYNICTTATLSRIENGLQSPSKRMMDKILERLGIETDMFDAFVNQEELEFYELKKSMSRCIAKLDMKEVEYAYVNLMERLSDKQKESEKQYLMWIDAVLMIGKGDSPDRVRKLLMEAIHLTLPEFDGKTPLINNLLTYDEIIIINSLASQYARNNEMATAIRIGMWLKEYMKDKMAEGNMKVSKYPTVLYNLSNWLGKIECFNEALEITNEGVAYCIKYGNGIRLPYLLFNKGCALAELGNVKEAKNVFTQSITFFELVEQKKERKMAIEWCNKRYNLHI